MLKFLTVVGRVLRKFPRFPSLWYMPDNNDCLALNMSGTMDIIDFSPVIRSYYTTEGKGVIQM